MRQIWISKREGLVGKKLTLLIADTSALHARGISVPGAVRTCYSILNRKTVFINIEKQARRTLFS